MFKYAIIVAIINMVLNLQENVKLFCESAELVYARKDYTSATILYFKALFVTYDFMLLTAVHKTPKDHTERFSLLRMHFPEEYELLDRYFSVYRSTYTATIDYQTALEIRNYVTKTIRTYIGN